MSNFPSDLIERTTTKCGTRPYSITGTIAKGKAASSSKLSSL
jgi:hypothetical protein